MESALCSIYVLIVFVLEIKRVKATISFHEVFYIHECVVIIVVFVINFLE